MGTGAPDDRLVHLYLPGDRAIDRILRALPLVLMSGDARLALVVGAALACVRAWSGVLIHGFVVITCRSAGLGEVRLERTLPSLPVKGARPPFRHARDSAGA